MPLIPRRTLLRTPTLLRTRRQTLIATQTVIPTLTLTLIAPAVIQSQAPVHPVRAAAVVPTPTLALTLIRTPIDCLSGRHCPLAHVLAS